MSPKQSTKTPFVFQKAPSGIDGLDEITSGGLPRGRTTLICGGPGCGKTVFGAQFLVRGAVDYDEPGVLMTFEEREGEIRSNVASMGFDVPALVRRKKLIIDHVRLERSEIEETGAYDLEGLFVRLAWAIDSIGAKRVVLDTIEAIFAGLSQAGILRAELRRLFFWLKERGVTAIVTGERGEGTLTRHGLEEYVSDCVIVLDHRVQSQVSTRRMRIVKYRGSSHGTNEYPFIIGSDGITVLPVTSAGLTHEAHDECITTGVPRLDAMLDGRGFYRGSSNLISGAAGSGKTSIAAHFVDATCRRGERCLYFASEESPQQIVRNMRSIGIDLQHWVDRGLLKIVSERPTAHGLETHLVEIHRQAVSFKPQVTVFDPVSNLLSIGTSDELRSALMRLLDRMKSEGVTTLFTTLTSSEADVDANIGVSSLMDCWIVLRYIEAPGERNRVLYIVKSRGMAHSNQLREFVLTNNGVDLLDVYIGEGMVLTGSARIAQENREAADEKLRAHDFAQITRELEIKRIAMKEKIAELKRRYAADEANLLSLRTEKSAELSLRGDNRRTMGRARYADGPAKQKTARRGGRR
ncbi:MAG: circadian clock protein KaiC [Thermoanaerobaculia bacterium]